MDTKLANWYLEPDDVVPGTYRLNGIPQYGMQEVNPEAARIRTSRIQGFDLEKVYTKSSTYALGSPDPRCEPADVDKYKRILALLPDPKQVLQQNREQQVSHDVRHAQLVPNLKGGYVLAGLMPGHPLNPAGNAIVKSSTLVAYDPAKQAFVTKSGSRYTPDPKTTDFLELEKCSFLSKALPKVTELTPLSMIKALHPFGQVGIEQNAGVDI